MNVHVYKYNDKGVLWTVVGGNDWSNLIDVTLSTFDEYLHKKIRFEQSNES